jgi:hypothetical protein
MDFVRSFIQKFTLLLFSFGAFPEFLGAPLQCAPRTLGTIESAEMDIKDIQETHIRETGCLTTYFIPTIGITWFLDFVHCPVLQRTQWFSNWICIRPQVKNSPTLLGPLEMC